MQQLDDLNFSGALILEIAGNSDADNVLDRARTSSRFLRKLSREQEFLVHKDESA